VWLQIPLGRALSFPDCAHDSLFYLQLNLDLIEPLCAQYAHSATAGPPRKYRPDYTGGIDLSMRLSTQFSAVGTAAEETQPGSERPAGAHEAGDGSGQRALSRQGSGGSASCNDDDDPWLLLAADVNQHWNAFEADFQRMGSLRQHAARGEDPMATARLRGDGDMLAQLQELQVLGHGAYGRAVKARWAATGEVVVVKQVRIDLMEAKEREEAGREVAMMQLLDHPNCIKYRTSFVQDGSLYIIMEHATRGDLWELIQECMEAGTPLSEHRIMSYFCQICLALHHLQQRGILHRDLKTQNIFLSDNNMIKVRVDNPHPRRYKSIAERMYQLNRQADFAILCSTNQRVR
jgi:hypothetical protein